MPVANFSPKPPSERDGLFWASSRRLRPSRRVICGRNMDCWVCTAGPETESRVAMPVARAAVSGLGLRVCAPRLRISVPPRRGRSNRDVLRRPPVTEVGARSARSNSTRRPASGPQRGQRQAILYFVPDPRRRRESPRPGPCRIGRSERRCGLSCHTFEGTSIARQQQCGCEVSSSAAARIIPRASGGTH